MNITTQKRTSRIAQAMKGLWPKATKPILSTTTVAALAVTAAAAPGDLTFIDAYKSGESITGGTITGLDGAEKPIVSPDGKHVYAVAKNTNTNQTGQIIVFERDQTTGALSYVETESGHPGIDGVKHGIVSPDGAYYYICTLKDQSVLTFSRDATTGELTYLNTLDLNANLTYLGITPDGENLYAVSSRHVERMTIDTSTGIPTWIERIKPTNQMAGDKLTISGDGKFLYYGDINAYQFDSDAGDGRPITVFEIDETTGALTQIQQIVLGHPNALLDGVTDLKLTPNGEFLFVATTRDDTIVVFSRDTTTGLITFASNTSSPSGAVRSLDVSPDGNFLLVAEQSNAVRSYSINQTTGALTLVFEAKDGVDGVDGVARTLGISVSPDGTHVYSTGRDDDAVAAFSLEPALTSSLSIGSVSGARGATVDVPVNMDSQGEVNSIGFSISFDPTQLTYNSIANGADAPGDWFFSVNDSDIANGNLGVIAGRGAGNLIDSGDLELLTFSFTAASDADAADASIALNGDVTYLEIVDADANEINAAFNDGAFSVQNTAPTLTLATATAAFVENGGAIGLDASATVSDDFGTHDGGSFTIAFSANGSSDDRLAVEDQGSGAGQIGLSGSDVQYEGTTIGSFTGGTDGSTPLVVSLNASATTAAVQALARAITFDNISDNPSVLDRTVDFTFVDGDAGSSGAQSMTVTVQAVNDDPTLDALADVTIDEDASEQTVNLAGIAAGGGEVQDLVVTASSDNTGLIPNPTVTYTSDDATGSIAFTPVADQSGTATITVTVTDAGLDGIAGNADDASVSQTFIVTVNAINDDPTLDALADVTIDEDASEQTVNLAGIAAGGAETQDLVVTASSDNTGLIPNPTVTYTSANATGSIAFTPVADESGTATVTVTVTDAGLDGTAGTADDGSVSQTFTVTVNAVNDDPTLDAIADLTIDEDASEQTVNLAGIDAGGSETQDLVVTASSDNTGLIPNPTVTYTSANATGTIAFTPVADESGTATVTVTVTDAGLDGTAGNADDASVSQTFTVTVNAVNDDPTLDAIADVTIDEDASEQTVNLAGIAAGGSETQDLVVTASSDSAALIPDPVVTYTSANATGSIAFTPLADQNGTAVITVTVTDAGLDGTAGNADDASVSQTFTVTVNPVADDPVANNDDLTTPEDTALTFNATELLANDEDVDGEAISVIDPAGDITTTQGATVTYNAGVFTYDPTTVNATLLETIQRLAIGETLVDTFTYDIEDTTSASDTATVTITLTGTEYEADVVPDYGDNAVDVTDLNQVGLYVLGFDSPTSGNLFQRTDSAPRTSSGNGRLSVADWVQTARYILLDPLQSLDGATTSTAGATLNVSRARRTGTELDIPEEGVGFGLSSDGLKVGETQDVTLTWTPTPGVSAMSFSIAFDPNKLEFLEANLPPEQSAAMLMNNETVAGSGQVGFLIAARPGSELDATAPELLTLRFQVRGSGDAALGLSDFPTRTKISDIASRSVPFGVTPNDIKIDPNIPGFEQWAQDILEALGEDPDAVPHLDLTLSADPDGDGISNEWEFYLGLNPDEVNGSPLNSTLMSNSAGEERFCVSLEFRSDRMVGEYIAEISYDLVTWVPIEESIDQDLGGNRNQTTWEVDARPGQGYVRMRHVRP